MRFRIAPDLHLGSAVPWSPPAVPWGDVAVVAGDVGEGIVTSLA